MSQGWPIVQVGEVLRLNLDRVPIDNSATYPMVGVLSFGRGLFDREPIENGNTSYKYFNRLSADHVVMSQLFGWEGALALSAERFAGKFLSPQFPTFLCDKNRLDRAFLGWLLRRPTFWEDLGSRTSGMGDRRRTLNPEALFACKIPLPPLSEQRRIVARIDALAAEIKEAGKLRVMASQEALALIASALRRLCTKLPLTGTIGDILLSKPRNGWSARCDNVETGMPVLSLSAVTGFHYRKKEYKRTIQPAAANGHFWLNPGDLLITRSNTPELVGHVAIYDGSPFPCIYPDLMMKLIVNPEAANKEFVWYWFQNPVAREFITKYAKGTSPTMKKISQSIVMGIPFPTSFTVAEQRLIVVELDELQAKVDNLKRHQAETAVELNALLPAILDRAFRGEL